jgi:transposase InsO family protein
MTEELQELGLEVGHRRVGRLMRENGIKAVRTRKYKATTDSNHAFAVAPMRLPSFEKGQYFGAVLQTAIAAIRQQEADQGIYDAQICRVVNFPLVSRRGQDSGAFQHRQMSRQRRGQDIQPARDFSNLQAIWSRADEQAENRHAG